MLRRSLVITLMVLCSGSSEARAQAGVVLDFDLSPRSVALAGTSAALFWGNDFDHWANPALTAFVHGLSYEYRRAQLVPGLAPDVAIESQPIKIGGGGAGVVASGKPSGKGVQLSFGDPSTSEEADAWGFGVSATGLAGSMARLSGREMPDWMKRADVAYGMNFKNVRSTLLGSTDETDVSDWGVLLRVTPVLREIEGAPEFRVDLAYGHSVLSQEDGAELFGSRISKHERDGIAAHLTWDPWLSTLSDLPDGWFFRGFSPLLSIGATAGWAKVSRELPNYETSGQGLEVELANVVAVRVGHYRDPDGQVEGATWGVGFGLPIGRIGRLQYDTASTPQAITLDHRQHHGFTLWLDPLAAWRTLHRS